MWSVVHRNVVMRRMTVCAGNATVCFRNKHILLSGYFTFLIYCVLLMEDTLSTKESNDKSFAIFRCQTASIPLILHQKTQLPHLIIENLRQSTVARNFTSNDQDRSVLRTTFGLDFCLWQITVVYAHIYNFLYYTVIATNHATTVAFNNAAWLTLNLWSRKMW